MALLLVSHKTPNRRRKFMTLVVDVAVTEAPAHCGEKGSSLKTAVSQQLSNGA